MGTALAVGMVVCFVTGSARADDKSLYDRLWPRVPEGHQLSLSRQIEEQLTELGNLVGHHLDLLSHDMLELRVDARRRRAYVRVGGGDEEHLTLRLASDVQFTDGMAQINTRIDLSIRGRKLRLVLPEMEMVPASFHGERGVELRMPLFRHRF